MKPPGLLKWLLELIHLKVQVPQHNFKQLNFGGLTKVVQTFWPVTSNGNSMVSGLQGYSAFLPQ